jgi:hypothetical protein
MNPLHQAVDDYLELRPFGTHLANLPQTLY